jgi:desulfoferrodoxin (superoxide reductase-like protein)
MNNKKLKPAALFPVLILFLFSCNFFSGKEEGPNEFEPFREEEGPLIKYHSVKKAGKWKDQAADHVPEYTVVYNEDNKNSKNKIIKVSVPFEGRQAPLHYIELIILADYNHKELQKVEFPLGNKYADAEFKLPKGYKSYVYIIAKCNLHDMWETRVDWEK